MKKIIFLAACALCGIGAASQPVLSSALQSCMVVQQNQPFRIWGRCVPGQLVEVSADWTLPASGVTASDSTFLVIIPVPVAKRNDFTSHTLQVKAAGGSVVLDSLLIGDVWFCSGQSNMQFSLKEDRNAAIEVPAANYPYIRLLSADLNFSATPIENFKGTWKACNPGTAKDFSAVGYSFGKNLYNNLQIPIGLVWSGIGASAAQAFVPQEVLAADTMLNRVYLQPYLASELSKEKIDGGFSFEKVTRPFLLYNAMIHPFRNLSVKGICWYQGESNRMERESYTHLMYAMIKAWRNKFSQGQLPFYYVQVAPFYWDKENPELADYSFFREAQERIMRLSGTGMAVTTDVGEAKDLHPKNKIPIGHRLAAMALKRTYGFVNLVDEGPAFDYFEVAGSRMVVHFRAEGSLGLNTNDGKAPAFFTLAGKDGKFFPANAKISGNTVELTSSSVPRPMTVRYAFTNYAVTNLQNAAGFPALPFRSDDFAEPAIP